MSKVTASIRQKSKFTLSRDNEMRTDVRVTFRVGYSDFDYALRVHLSESDARTMPNNWKELLEITEKHCHDRGIDLWAVAEDCPNLSPAETAGLRAILQKAGWRDKLSGTS